MDSLWEVLRRIRVETDYGIDRITDEGVLPLTEDGVPIRKLFITNIALRVSNIFAYFIDWLPVSTVTVDGGSGNSAAEEDFKTSWTTYQNLITLFSKYGTVESCYLKRTHGKSNYAFIIFSTVEAAMRARVDGCKKNINLHFRDLKVMPADSWHQPDSRSYTSTRDWHKSHKKSSVEEINENYVQNDSNSPIDALNDDCLMHIFLHLPIRCRIRIERVCKRWRAVSQESWRAVQKMDLCDKTWELLNTRALISTANLREVLIRCGRFLNHVDFSQYNHSLNRSAILTTSKFCPNLQVIDFTGIKIYPSGIESLARNCKNIKRLSLRCTQHVTDKDLIALFETNKGLTYLNLVEAYIFGECLSYLPPETFEELDLNFCFNIKEKHFSRALAKFKNLKNLILRNCSNGYMPIMMTQEGVLQITRLVNLTILQLWQNPYVTDDFLITLAAECKQLNYLDITSCYKVTDKGLEGAATLPKLETLIIGFLRKVTTINLDKMYNIKHLDCRGCCLISDAGLTTLGQASPKLGLLDLSGCTDITNDTINIAIDTTSRRTNNNILTIFIGGTSVCSSTIQRTSPYLLLVNLDSSIHTTTLNVNKI